MIIFDGYQQAAVREAALIPKVAALKAHGLQPRIAAILFTEDAGSLLYTRLKSEAAARVGIEYKIYSFSLVDDVAKVIEQIKILNNDPQVTGIIIQKPGKQTWVIVTGAVGERDAINAQFHNWWQSLVSQLAMSKDVDGLHPATLVAVQAGNWQEKGRVLPATARAVLEILQSASQQLFPDVSFADFLLSKKIAVIGKSEIVGKPLFYELLNKKCDVEMIGTKEINAKIEQKEYLFDYDVIISSTGHADVVTGELISNGTILIDVGEPRADMERSSVATKASFLTPVPGGVGPMTVVCLLENAVRLATL